MNTKDFINESDTKEQVPFGMSEEMTVKEWIDASDVITDNHPNSRKIEIHRILHINEGRQNEGMTYLSELEETKKSFDCPTDKYSFKRITALTDKEEKVLLSIVTGYPIEEIYKKHQGKAPQMFETKDGSMGISTIGSNDTSLREDFLANINIVIGKNPLILEIGKTLYNDKPIGYPKYKLDEKGEIVTNVVGNKSVKVIETDENGDYIINLPLKPLDYIKYMIALKSPVVAKNDREKHSGFLKHFYIVDKKVETKKELEFKLLEDKATDKIQMLKTEPAKVHVYLTMFNIPHKYDKTKEAINTENYFTLKSYVLNNKDVNKKELIIKEFVELANDASLMSKFYIKLMVKRGQLLEMGDEPKYLHPETKKTLATGINNMVIYYDNTDNSEVIEYLKALGKNK